MSESISNIRNIPATNPLKPVVQSDKDRKPGQQKIERDKPDENADQSQSSDGEDSQDQPLLDEYV